MRWTSSDTEMVKPVAGATIGSIVAAVAAMFAPVAPVEHLTSATGLSEMIPSLAPPLGHTAQSLLAFGVGVATFFILLLFLMERPKRPLAASKVSRGQKQRSEAPVAKAHDEDEAQASAPWLDTGSAELPERKAPFAGLIAKIGARLSSIAREGLARRASSDDLGDFSDLKRNRGFDSHRSILNARDLGEPLPPLVDPDPVPFRAEEQVRPGLSDALELLEAAGSGLDDDGQHTGADIDDASDGADYGAESPAFSSVAARAETGTSGALRQEEDSSFADSGEAMTVAALDSSRAAAAGRDRTIDNLMARLERGLEQRRVARIAEPAPSIAAVDPVMSEPHLAEPRIGRGHEDLGGDAGTGPALSSPAPFRSISSTGSAQSAGGDEPMDEGLRNALKTLRRMTAHGN